MLVTAPKGKSLRAYVNVPDRRKLTLGKLIIKRKAFPLRRTAGSSPWGN